ncbi:MAG: prolyl oligopeptidase family serine peptidase [Puniceicoccales bacterium]|jgi:predicted peptidase|nr:prolyl oligopeptidase family serine peptidase [Puniceicoccales bacterium]
MLPFMRHFFFFSQIPLLALCALVFVFGAAGSSAALVDSFEPGVHTKGKATLPYRLLKPEKIERGKKYPIVLFLHGAGECGKDNQKQLHNGVGYLATPQMRAKHPCFILVPQCPSTSVAWRAGRSADAPLTTALALLDELIKKHPVDKQRVYISGLSMGGMGTFKALELRPRFFAAAIPICGAGNAVAAKAYSRTPVWIFHGAKDNVVPPGSSKAIAEALKKASPKTPHKITLFPNVGHNAWDPALRDPATWEWLFAQKRGGS